MTCSTIEISVCSTHELTAQDVNYELILEPEILLIEINPQPSIGLHLEPVTLQEIVVENEVLEIELSDLTTAISVYEIDEYYQVLPITNGQDEFILDYSPLAPARSKLFLNGQKLFYGEDYNAAGNVIYWLAPQFLESGDRLEIYYY
ncbi:hypothetical protein H6G45_09160 [Synechocystis sp. FACHB-383]|uniref:hypothetical protein n=1 Tax=Synechocystis sp. FACHB-383 TaxID=2692864 RepID=UPI0016880B3A|nr:hypothetical protein [Synechocystis sp. FACHB-383]MBD2653654.1 hypothetical protein [Synechocystis sp. FACHB-383]